MFLECLKQFLKHEVDEDSGVTRFGTGIDRLVIALLIVMNHAFDREMLENGIQPGENQRLPESAHASVAVGKRMNEFELVVEHAAADQQVIFGMFQPVEKVGDQSRNPFGGRGNMNRLFSGENADSAMTELSGIVNQGGHHDTVCLEQVVDGKRVELREEIVSGDGVSDLLNFTERSYDSFSVQNIGDLVLGKCIPLDRQRRLDGFDLIRLAQFQGIVPLQMDGVTLGERGDLRNHRDRFGRHGKWWFFTHNEIFLPLKSVPISSRIAVALL